MKQGPTHYISPKIQARANPAKGNYGLFARQPIRAGELLIVWGGIILTGEELEQYPPEKRMHSVQVEENLYQLSPCEPEPGDYINHCCAPNAGLSGQVAVVAMRDIAPGEEVCFDYAMSDGTPYDEFACACGAPNCRGQVTGDDWRRPDLQARYAGYFSPYLQRRIDQVRREREQMVSRNGRVNQLSHAPN
jgi:uncharacterized protein